MKATFKQSHKHWRFYLVLFCFIILIICCYFSKVTISMIPMIIIFCPIFMLFFRKYQITDDDLLKGNGTISIQAIQKIVHQSEHVVDLYYISKKSGKINIKRFFPLEKDMFVSRLTEINPKIQIV